MPITYIKADASDPVVPVRETGRDDLQGHIVHVTNNVGAWGRGFTRALDQRFNPHWVDKFGWTLADEFNGHPRTLGRITLMQPPTAAYPKVIGIDIPFLIVCLMAQNGLPSKNNPMPLDYVELEACLKGLRELLGPNKDRISLQMPRIGCGLARGSWSKVGPMLLKHFGDFPYVYVCDLNTRSYNP